MVAKANMKRHGRKDTTVRMYWAPHHKDFNTLAYTSQTQAIPPWEQ